LRKIQKNVKFKGIFHELYKFAIVIIFHVDVKVNRQYEWHVLTTYPCQKPKHFAHFFGEYPSKLGNIKDFQSSLGVFGDMYTVATSTFTGHSAAQTFPHESEAGYLNNIFAMFSLSSFMRK
jgi:hypothetical protein